VKEDRQTDKNRANETGCRVFESWDFSSENSKLDVFSGKGDRFSKCYIDNADGFPNSKILKNNKRSNYAIQEREGFLR